MSKITKTSFWCRLFGHRMKPVSDQALMYRDKDTGQRVVPNFAWCERRNCLHEEIIVKPAESRAI